MSVYFACGSELSELSVHLMSQTDVVSHAPDRRIDRRTGPALFGMARPMLKRSAPCSRRLRKEQNPGRAITGGQMEDVVARLLAVGDTPHHGGV